MNLFDKYKDKQNVLTIDNIVDSKIILCVSTDIVLYWVYYLSPDSNIVSVNNNYVVFRLNDGQYIIQITKISLLYLFVENNLKNVFKEK